jgi:hypothetical protein
VYPAKRVATVAVAAAISIATASAPAAMATTSKHWTTAQCQSWEKSFLKRNPHASKTRKAEGNKVLKGQGCTQRIK